MSPPQPNNEPQRVYINPFPNVLGVNLNKHWRAIAIFLAGFMVSLLRSLPLSSLVPFSVSLTSHSLYVTNCKQPNDLRALSFPLLFLSSIFPFAATNTLTQVRISKLDFPLLRRSGSPPPAGLSVLQ